MNKSFDRDLSIDLDENTPDSQYSTAFEDESIYDFKGKTKKFVSKENIQVPDENVLPNDLKRKADCSPNSQPKKRTVFSDITNALSKPFAAVNKKFTSSKKAISKSLSKSQKSHSQIGDAVENTLLSITEESPEPESTNKKAPSENKENTLKEMDPSQEIIDYDQESRSDPNAEAEYAKEVFEYFMEKDKEFVIQKYMEKQPEISKNMRAILVDWMVEVQESFELNHETLYLAVRLVDHYLARKVVQKAALQLVGATAVLVAAKFDERIPPLIDDFIYICDDAYTKKELLALEQKLLLAVDFRLGMPLSYRFLRRFSRCQKENMITLTLARYILELSLQDYDVYVGELESKLAAAALLLARKLRGEKHPWPANLSYHSHYSQEQLTDLVARLNLLLASPSPTQKNLKTIREKYSHTVFHEVSKVHPLPINDNQ